jgi:hypothetical protein
MRNDPGRDSLDAWKPTGRARGCLQRAASIAGDDHQFLWRDPDFCGGGSAVFAQTARIISSIAQPKPLINLSKFHNPFMQFLLHAHTERLLFIIFDLYASNLGNII